MTRPSRSETGRFCTIWSRPSLEKRNRIGFGKSGQAYTFRPDSSCTLAVMAITGCNQNTSASDPACLLANYSTVYWLIISACFCRYGTWTHSTWSSANVPGPKPWPLTGNMTELMKKVAWHQRSAPRFWAFMLLSSVLAFYVPEALCFRPQCS